MRRTLPLAAAPLIAAATLAIAACRSPATGEAALHVRDGDADFAALGLARDRVEAWEDGRRSPIAPECYEWWYFDGILEDGTVIVAWLGDNWGYGSRTRNVSLEVTPPGAKTLSFYKQYADHGSYSTERADTRFGPHSFSGDLRSYRIRIDPADAGGLGIDLELLSRVPPYRPATGHVAAGRDFFAWLVAVPEGSVAGKLTIAGVTRAVRGAGYHDHNWGNVSPVDLMDGWWWGRSKVGERTVIVAELRAKPARGGTRIPLYLVASPAGREVDAYGASVRFLEGAPMPHPDPAHIRPVGSWISLRTEAGYEARLAAGAAYIASVDLLEMVGGAAGFFGRLAGARPWYTRFASPASLEVPGEGTLRGAGTLELFEFN